MALNVTSKKEANRLNVNMAYLNHASYIPPVSKVWSSLMKNSVCSSEEKSKSPWGKIFKLFLEFVVAAVTALVTTISGQSMNLW